MLKNKRCLIIGSGASIRKGQWNIDAKKLPIWWSIRNEFTIGINWSFKYFQPTMLVYSDYHFYNTEKDNLKKLPLVVASQDSYYTRILKKNPDEMFHLHDNIYLLKASSQYHGVDSLTKGVYTRKLSGMFALTTAISLGFTEIYLFGMDCCSTEGRTHFYEGDKDVGVTIDKSGKKNCGIGMEDGKYKTSIYSNINMNEIYLPYKKELERIKIFNVSLDSKINVFPKIGYSSFYSKIFHDKLNINQEEARKETIQKFKEYYD